MAAAQQRLRKWTATESSCDTNHPPLNLASVVGVRDDWRTSIEKIVHTGTPRQDLRAG